MNWVTLWATASARVSTEKTAMLEINVVRRPNLSVSGPTPTAPMPMPTSPTVEAIVSEESVNPRAPVADRVGITAPSTTRSNPSSATATQHNRTGQKPTEAAARVACRLEVDVAMT